MLKKVVSPTWNGACVLMQQKSRYSDKITFTTRTMIKIRMTNQLTPVRNFGVMDSLTGMAKQKMEDSREKQFAAMIENMVSQPKWSLRPWRSSLETQLNSWGMYMPGVSTSPEMLELKKFKEILDFMSVQEIDNPDLLTGPAREKIAKLSGRTIEDLNKLLFVYKQSLIVYIWLQENFHALIEEHTDKKFISTQRNVRKKLKEALPTNQAELMFMQNSDPRLRAIGQKISFQRLHTTRMSPTRNRTGRGKGTPF